MCMKVPVAQRALAKRVQVQLCFMGSRLAGTYGAVAGVLSGQVVSPFAMRYSRRLSRSAAAMEEDRERVE